MFWHQCAPNDYLFSSSLLLFMISISSCQLFYFLFFSDIWELYQSNYAHNVVIVLALPINIIIYIRVSALPTPLQHSSTITTMILNFEASGGSPVILKESHQLVKNFLFNNDLTNTYEQYLVNSSVNYSSSAIKSSVNNFVFWQTLDIPTTKILMWKLELVTYLFDRTKDQP